MTTLAHYVGLSALIVAAFFVLSAVLLLVWAAGETAADNRRKRAEARSRERWVG